MKSLSMDTEHEAEEMKIRLLRQVSPARRLELAFQFSAMIWNGARAAMDRLYPEETLDQRDYRFLKELYGDPLARDFISYRQRMQGPKNEKLSP